MKIHHGHVGDNYTRCGRRFRWAQQVSTDEKDVNCLACLRALGLIANPNSKPEGVRSLQRMKKL